LLDQPTPPDTLATAKPAAGAAFELRASPSARQPSTVAGPYPQVTSLGRVVPAGKASKTVYCHLACALWVPEIEVSDHNRMEGLRLDKLTAVRAKLRCELCKQAGGAAV
jgi:hypothetical protein